MDNREKLLQLVEEGLINPNYVIMAFVKWCTNDQIGDMCHLNEILLDEDDEEDEDEDLDDSMDGDFDSAMASAGYGTDEDYGCYGGDEW
jgi:hypothetical protein